MLAQIVSTTSSANPKIAAIVEDSISQAFCMAFALAITNLNASSKDKV